MHLKIIHSFSQTNLCLPYIIYIYKILICLFKFEDLYWFRTHLNNHNNHKNNDSLNLCNIIARKRKYVKDMIFLIRLSVIKLILLF